MGKEMYVYDGKVYGVEVSEYGLENGYLDYKALANIMGDCIANNTVREETKYDWEMVNGELEDNELICHEFIISEYGYKLLADYTDEVVFYNEQLDIYVWAVTHTGTSWNYVLTDIKLIME